MKSRITLIFDGVYDGVAHFTILDTKGGAETLSLEPKEKLIMSVEARAPVFRAEKS